MTARATSQLPRRRLDSISETFSELDQATAIAEIRRLADSGLTDREIAERSGWRIADVCRAIGQRL